MARKKAPVILVSGSRAWGEERAHVIRRELAQFPKGSWVIHGAQRRRDPDSYASDTPIWFGVDYWADRIAQEIGMLRITVPFAKHLGPAGGPVRNQAMVDIAVALRDAGHEVSGLFFHDDIEGGSRGAKGCRDLAVKAGIDDLRVIDG